jgi:hypothetical protein
MFIATESKRDLVDNIIIYQISPFIQALQRPGEASIYPASKASVEGEASSGSAGGGGDASPCKKCKASVEGEASSGSAGGGGAQAP